MKLSKQKPKESILTHNQLGLDVVLMGKSSKEMQNFNNNKCKTRVKL